MGFVRCRVGGIELNWRFREGGGEVAYLTGRLTSWATTFRHRGFLLYRFEIIAAFDSGIVHAEQIPRRPRLLEGFRHHDRDGLVVVLNLRPSQ